MRMAININDFRFILIGCGKYTVTYTSPKTGRIWAKLVTDMTLIDRTKNMYEPKKKDLEELKRTVKN